MREIPGIYRIHTYTQRGLISSEQRRRVRARACSQYSPMSARVHARIYTGRDKSSSFQGNSEFTRITRRVSAYLGRAPMLEI